MITQKLQLSRRVRGEAETDKTEQTDNVAARIQIRTHTQIGRTRCFVALMLLVPNTDNRGASSPIRTPVPFIQMTERTSTHAYPREEIHAMMNFYGGKTCVLTHNRLTVHWAHMFDAALLTSNQRVRHTFHLQLSSLLTLKMQLISFNGC
jgi:hypothetical protein